QPRDEPDQRLDHGWGRGLRIKVADQGDADGARVVVLGMGPHRGRSAGTPFIDVPLWIDHEVVANIAPAIPKGVIGPDAPDVRGSIAAVATIGVVNNDVVRLLKEGNPAGAVLAIGAAPGSSGDGHGPAAGRARDSGSRREGGRASNSMARRRRPELCPGHLEGSRLADALGRCRLQAVYPEPRQYGGCPSAGELESQPHCPGTRGKGGRNNHVRMWAVAFKGFSQGHR